MSNDQANAFASLGIDVTPEVLEKHKLVRVLGRAAQHPRLQACSRRTAEGAAVKAAAQGAARANAGARTGRNHRGAGRGSAIGVARQTGLQPVAESAGLHRRPRLRPADATKEEIRRGVSAFSASSCDVKSDGGSLAVTFPGMKLGIFDGNLRFTVYRGTNLIQMDAIAQTNEPSVAYKYDAGLKGFSTATMPRVTWRDTGGHPQQHQFGGPKAIGTVRLSGQPTVSSSPKAHAAPWPTFPPPHTFFFTREVDVNLGYVFYRNDGGGDLQHRRDDARGAKSDTFPQYEQNYALYNAPPGTWQKMSMYFYASPERR